MPPPLQTYPSIQQLFLGFVHWVCLALGARQHRVPWQRWPCSGSGIPVVGQRTPLGMLLWGPVPCVVLSERSRVKKSVPVMLSFCERQQLSFYICIESLGGATEPRWCLESRSGEWGRRDFISTPSCIWNIVPHAFAMLQKQSQKKAPNKTNRSQRSGLGCPWLGC